MKSLAKEIRSFQRDFGGKLPTIFNRQEFNRRKSAIDFRLEQGETSGDTVIDFLHRSRPGFSDADREAYECVLDQLYLRIGQCVLRVQTETERLDDLRLTLGLIESAAPRFSFVRGAYGLILSSRATRAHVVDGNALSVVTYNATMTIEPLALDTNRDCFYLYGHLSVISWFAHQPDFGQSLFEQMLDLLVPKSSHTS